MEIIENLGIATFPAIIALCYLVGLGAKAVEVIPDKYIPVICGVAGLLLGIAAMLIIPEFPAQDYITAAAVGAMSGLAATGINQVYKQLSKEE